VAAGAHPSYPDREGFGRRSIAIEPALLEAAIGSQCAALRTIASEHAIAVAHAKPHGALYHDANRDRALADAVVRGVRAGLGDPAGLAILGPPSGALSEAARAAGVRYLREGFADRATRADGSLIPRGEPGALIEDPAAAAARARALADSGSIDALCVHADTSGALAIARAVHEAIAPIAVRARPSLAADPFPSGRAEFAAPANREVQAIAALGDRAIRFARPVGVSPAAIVAAVRAWPGVIDVVVAREDVAAYFDHEPPGDTARERGAIAALSELPGTAPSARTVELHATYDGPDLAFVAGEIGAAVDDVIGWHAAATYVVETIGFAPGFAYLAGLDPRLAIPRRATPRTRVPAGSLAIAGDRTAVYPFDSPGGWHLIGRVDERMFGPEGARLHLGDAVRFVRGSR